MWNFLCLEFSSICNLYFYGFSPISKETGRQYGQNSYFIGEPQFFLYLIRCEFVYRDDV